MINSFLIPIASECPAFKANAPEPIFSAITTRPAENRELSNYAAALLSDMQSKNSDDNNSSVASSKKSRKSYSSLSKSKAIELTYDASEFPSLPTNPGRYRIVNPYKKKITSNQSVGSNNNDVATTYSANSNGVSLGDSIISRVTSLFDEQKKEIAEMREKMKQQELFTIRLQTPWKPTDNTKWSIRRPSEAYSTCWQTCRKKHHTKTPADTEIDKIPALQLEATRASKITK